jgi:hypothetical protein
MIQLYLHCTLETVSTPHFPFFCRFSRRAKPVILKITSTRDSGNPEEIVAKEVISG